MAKGPDELGKTLGLLRAALHAEVTSLNGRSRNHSHRQDP